MEGAAEVNRRKKSDKRHAIRAAVESLEKRMLLSRYGEVFPISGVDEYARSTVEYTPEGTALAVYTTVNFAQSLHLQALSSDGTPVGSDITLRASGPRIADSAITADGSLVVAWDEYSDVNGGYNVFVQRFNTAGQPLGDAVRVDAVSGRQPVVAASPDGGFAVAYTIGSDYADIVVRRFDAQGKALGTQVAVANGSAMFDLQPSIAYVPDGRMVVTWGGQNPHIVYFRLVDQAGNPIGAIQTTGDGYSPDVATDSDGGWTIVWNGPATGIYMRQYGADAQPVGEAVHLDFGLPRGMIPSIAREPDGGLVVTWMAEDVTYVARYSADGQAIGVATPISVGGAWVVPDVVANPAGEYMVVWFGGRYSGGSILGARFGPGTSLRAIADKTFTVAEGGQVTLSANADFILGQTITAWEWDFNYDGQTFQVDATGIAPAFGGAGIDGPATRTIGVRVRADDGSVSGVASTSVSVTNVAPTATFSAGGAVEPGSVGTVSFSNATDASLADRNAGFTYSYDFNNDGTFEITSSRTSSATVPASYLANPGSHTLRGRITDKNGGSRIYTTTLSVVAIPPTAAFATGGSVSLGAAGSVSFTQVHDSPGDLAAGFTYSYDFNNDGAFDIINSRASTVTVPTQYLRTAGAHTIRGRISDVHGASSSYTANLRVIATPPTPPTALFSTGGSVTLGSSAILSFAQIQDSPGDIAAGFTYGYDLTNDGTYEITSRSPVYEVPASMISAPATYRFLGRITDQFGAYSDYSTELRVTVPPDYFPTIAGLATNLVYTGHGETYGVTRTIRREQFNGEDCTVIEFGNAAGGATIRQYLARDGQAFLYRHYEMNRSSTTSEYAPQTRLTVYAFDKPVGWSEFTPNTVFRGTARTSSESATISAITSSTFTVVAVEPITLSNGVHFDEAMAIRLEEEGEWTYAFSDGHSETNNNHVTDTSWFVRGLGLVKNQHHDESRWTNSYDESNSDTSDATTELSSIPEWARYTEVTSRILQINGTGISDDIRFEAGATELTVYRNGLPETVPYANITGIVINGLDGDDRIDLSALSFPATITGGAGNDTITGGSGADLIYGGDGDDVLSGGVGSDTIYGNFGNDSIAGGLQRDSIMGGLGDDTITAGDGPDSVYGGDGRDMIRGGKGADYIEGKGKADTIYGSFGNDTIYGNAGDDLIYAEDGDDRVYVNDGAVLAFHDTVYAGAGADVIDRDALDWVIDDEVAVLA